MRDDLIDAGATASFVASLSMALLAAVALANAGGPAIRMLFETLVALCATVLSLLLLHRGFELRATGERPRRKPSPVPIRITERRRVRR